jgi:hypothetical protein
MQEHRTKGPSLRLVLSLVVAVGPFLHQGVESFLTTPPSSTRCHANDRSFLQVSTPSSASAASTATTPTSNNLEQKVKLLKAVLQKEYVSFFDPMERDYYSDAVTFDDPLSSLAGVEAYQKNVDMLAARTTFGDFVFRDASIILHSVTGGDVVENTDGSGASSSSVSDITTRWTLRMTLKVLPWTPTARFSGVSIYKIGLGGPKGVQILKQTDYWDSINMVPGGTYQGVGKGAAFQDFLQQLKPENMQAIAAAPELPFTLLRRSQDYQVRRYPAYTAVMAEYERRDEGFTELGVYTTGMQPLAPALMEVTDEKNNDSDDSSVKTMAWPLVFAAPGSDTPPTVTVKEGIVVSAASKCKLVTVSAKTVAVGSFSDASVAPVVRKADIALRACLRRDGIDVPADTEGRFKFAQYDAVYSMGKRRGEVWIELEDGGHPW